MTFEEPEEEESRRLSPWAALILVLLILSLLATLIWPALSSGLMWWMAPPTPTPPFLQEA